MDWNWAVINGMGYIGDGECHEGVLQLLSCLFHGRNCFSVSWQFIQYLKVNMDHLFSLIQRVRISCYLPGIGRHRSYRVESILICILESNTIDPIMYPKFYSIPILHEDFPWFYIKFWVFFLMLVTWTCWVPLRSQTLKMHIWHSNIV